MSGGSKRISAVCEVPNCLFNGDLINRRIEPREVGHLDVLQPLNVRLHLCKHLFYGRELWAIRRKEDEDIAPGLDELLETQPDRFVDGRVVHQHHRVRASWPVWLDERSDDALKGRQECLVTVSRLHDVVGDDTPKARARKDAVRDTSDVEHEREGRLSADGAAVGAFQVSIVPLRLVDHKELFGGVVGHQLREQRHDLGVAVDGQVTQLFPREALAYEHAAEHGGAVRVSGVVGDLVPEEELRSELVEERPGRLVHDGDERIDVCARHSCTLATNGDVPRLFKEVENVRYGLCAGTFGRNSRCHGRGDLREGPVAVIQRRVHDAPAHTF